MVIELGNTKAGHNNRAIIFEKVRDYPAAINEWTKVLKEDPNNPKAYCRRGILYEKVGNNKSAINDLIKGLKRKEQLMGDIREQAENLLQKLEIT